MKQLLLFSPTSVVQPVAAFCREAPLLNKPHIWRWLAGVRRVCELIFPKQIPPPLRRVKLSHLLKLCPPPPSTLSPSAPQGWGLLWRTISHLLFFWCLSSVERKMRSKWQAVQLSFEPNRWWRLSDSSVTASFEVIGDNLYFESELDHCQKGRRLICKRFYISPCFLGFLLSLSPPTPPLDSCFYNPCSRLLVRLSLSSVWLVLGCSCYESQQQLIKARDNLCYWCIVAFLQSS